MMSIQLLGPLRVKSGDCCLGLGGIKQRAVFAMLALRMNDGVGVDSLVNGLWDDDLPSHPRRTVQVYVSRLRKLLGSGPAAGSTLSIVNHGDGYSLQGNSDVCDFNRFQSLAEQGYASWPDDPPGTRAALGRALAEWRDEPLREFEREPFAESEGARLSALRAAALDLRIEADLACGEHRQLAAELEELTRRHPMDERLHAQLMIALYRNQRPAEALGVFRRLRGSLIRELAIEPSELVQGLHRAVLARSPDLDLPWPSHWAAASMKQLAADVPVPMAPGQRGSGPVDNLPYRPRVFVGRRQFLKKLGPTAGSGQPGRSVHVLHGIGGVGKTQIALEFAHAAADRFRLRWWIDAEEPGLIPQQITELGRAAGCRYPSGSNSSAIVLAWLATRADWLLIFDNASDPAAIARFLPAGPGTIVVTSRRRGWGELGSSAEVDVLSRTDTVALLQARVEKLDPMVADKIAEEIGDLPLAAAQIASYLEQTDTDPARYLEMFRARTAILLGRGEVVGYPARVDTTWRMSLDRLREESPAGLTLMETASMMAPDTIPVGLLRHAAERSMAHRLRDPATTEDALAVMVTYSLAQRRPGGFRVHRLLQEVIRQGLTEHRRQQFSRVVADMLLGGRPGPPERADQWSAYRTITPHVVAASHALGSSGAGRRLLLDTVSYLSATGDPRSTSTFVKQVLGRWVGDLGPDHVDVLALAAELVYATTWTGPASAAADQGIDLLRRAVAVLSPTHPITLAVAAHYSLALAWDGHAELALAIGRSTAERATLALGPQHPTTLLALANTTSAYGWLGHHRQARQVGALAYQGTNRALGPDHAVTLHAAAMLSYAELWLGEIDDAHRLARQAHERALRTHATDHPTTLWLSSTLAFAWIRLGRIDQAWQLAKEAHDRANAALGADHTVTLVAGSVAGLAALRAGAVDHMRALAHPTWNGLVRVHGVDHPVALGVATTICLGAAGSADRGLCALAFAWDTSTRSAGAFGADHPNTVNARRSAEALDALHTLKPN